MRGEPFSGWQDEFIVTFYPHVPASWVAQALGCKVSRIYVRAQALGLSKSDAFKASAMATQLRRDPDVGKATRFRKGHTTWNKGRKGYCAPGSEKGHFKPGQKPHTWRPIGSNRVSKDGYLHRKTADTGVTRRDYVPVHHLIWRWHGRTVPPGYALCFIDGDKTNLDINNLTLVSRQNLMQRNSVHNLPREVVQLVQLRGALVRKINRLEYTDDQ